MPDLFLILNHRLTEYQKEEARRQLGVSSLIPLPEELQQIWSHIPANGELPVKRIQKIIHWLSAKGTAGDFVLVQGDYGATYFLVEFCFQNNFIPVYATTMRHSREIKISENEIEKTNRFSHRQFRKYLRYQP